MKPSARNRTGILHLSNTAWKQSAIDTGPEHPKKP